MKRTTTKFQKYQKLKSFYLVVKRYVKSFDTYSTRRNRVQNHRG